jgi:hypothetical protein
MAITLVQTCSRCGRVRQLESLAQANTDDWATNVLNTLWDLCPPCRNTGAQWIEAGGPIEE